MITSMDKALVALFGAVIYFLSYFGIAIPEALAANLQPIVAAITPILVYLIPNKK